jgi:prepilin-type N-terminal cleavage/methylation domain-containing protein
MNFVKKTRGFTLIEIIIVIAIIALLMVATFFFARSQYVKGRDARRKADMHKIQEAVEEYEKDHDCYPQPALVVCSPGTGLIPYLSKVPCDFATGENYFYENDNDACAKWYRMFIFLDNQNDESILSFAAPYTKYNFYLASPNAPVPELSSSTPGPSSSPAPSSTPNPSCDGSAKYGCIQGTCTRISLKPDGCPVCNPVFDNSNCNGFLNCGIPALPLNECR